MENSSESTYAGVYHDNIYKNKIDNALVMFIMLRAMNYQYNKRHICYFVLYTVIIATVSYQFCSYIYCRDIHLHR